MQQKIPLNNGWWYRPTFSADDITGGENTTGFEPVDLPHTNRMLPYNYLDVLSYQLISCYKKNVTLPEDLSGKQVFLDFEGVMLCARVWCNGIEVGAHDGGYTPFTVDITFAAKPGAQNAIVVQVDSTERPTVPPFGGVVDYLTYGGIYREVSLRIADETRLERLWVTCSNPLEDEKSLVCGCELCAPTGGEATLQLTLAHSDGSPVATAAATVTLAPSVQRYDVTLRNLCGIALWSLDRPVLYTVRVRMDCGGVTDEAVVRFGFRAAQFTPQGFLLNGTPLKLVGLDRHQSYPYVGYAMPARVQRKDADILKEAACNIVRTSHYPQSRHFLDRCDEIGLLVMEELPGWQHIGDESWQEHSLQDIEDMITRDFNRPSIVLWGVRINESQDNHAFYVRTNALAHRLDPTRQTGGTRVIVHSECLEDVYTYNDFSHNGGALVFRPQRESTGLEHDVPTLVTESNGHMYPTKRFDQEARLVEHTLRHLRVIHEALGREDLCGGISWCAFDYNTHGCFGSGDKICYHGVFDMFRNPKYASFAYASQRDPAACAVLEPITQASRGERDGGGVTPFLVLTNCDFIRVWNNDALIGDFTPDHETFPHLPHPPITVPYLLEQAIDLGFSPADMAAFRDYLKKKLAQGSATGLTPEDYQYVGGLAKKYGTTLQALMGVLIKVGGGWGDAENVLRIEGFVDEKCVITRRIGERRYAARLDIMADDSVLSSTLDSYDATRITVKALDNMDNLMPFTQECVEVTLQGPAALLGPSRFPLAGGLSSFWVRTTGEKGSVQIHIRGLLEETTCHICIAVE